MTTLLTVDIGNTSISLGVFAGTKVVRTAMVETTLPFSARRKKLSAAVRALKKNSRAWDGAVICSVVPKATAEVCAVVRKETGVKAVVIGKDIIVPVVNRYRNPRQVGQDRLVCAYAAMELYGAPAVVIDFGTAITFDVVSRRKEYLGGLIVPGIRLSAESLFQKTALLPRVEIMKPGALIGRDTVESILSGLFHGYGAMSRGLIHLIAKHVGGRPKVIVTGGYTELIEKFIAKDIRAIDRHLVFKGMKLLWERHNAV
ncbi:MAG: type III pantothenate kinase [Candidatus Omnitrophota bacterium]|nr:type III pantothenate kinase [Candidatus Omnitrophota bacterium]MDZ4242311.1 type III pantothenate kinase [Candidatus Omnitrophota bacterium]